MAIYIVQQPPEYLIVTNKRDLTSDFVVRELRVRGSNFCRLNTEDIPTAKFTSACINSSTIKFENISIDIQRLRAAYFRRPLPPKLNHSSLSKVQSFYCFEEWSYLLRSLYLEIDEKWFSHPNNIILAEDKLRQIRVAKDIGFLVPETIVTNEIGDLQELFKNGDVVAKPLKQSLLEDPAGPGRVIYTTSIRSISEIDPDELHLAPVIFQRRIQKKFDVRVTVVEDIVFPVSINSQKNEITQTDWRHSNVINLEHEVFDLPQEIADLCRTIVRQLGLRFGAIDLVLDENGDFWFLECNPNGQWAWIENRTGLPITSAIVDSMEKLSI